MASQNCDTQPMGLQREDCPPGWLPMIDMPIGDHRNLVVEVRGTNRLKRALAYWTGEMWSHAPVNVPTHALNFEPVMYRQIKAEPVAPCSCISEIEGRLDEHKLDVAIMYDRVRASLNSRTFTSLIRRDNGRAETRSKKPKLFGHSFCPFCSAPYDAELEHPIAIAVRHSVAAAVSRHATLVNLDPESGANIVAGILAGRP